MAGTRSRFEQRIAEQNLEMDKMVAKLLDAIRLISDRVSIASSSGHPQHQRSYQAISAIHDAMYPSSKVVCGHKSGMDSNYSAVTRLSKLDFHRFSGDRVREWLFKLEQFFSLDFTPKELKVRVASSHFDVVAKKWHQSLLDTDFGERFAEVLNDPIVELNQLQETDGIDEYHARFELISSRVNLSEESLVNAYLKGLQLDTQINVRMFQPHSIHQCLMLGRGYEKAHPKKNSLNNCCVAKWSENNSQSKGILSSKPEHVHNTVLLTSMERPKDPTTQPHKVLSIEDRSKNNQKLCYFGDEKYKETRFEAEEDSGKMEEVHMEKVELEKTGIVAHISVNAISGVSDYRTMRVKGLYEKQVLSILIDPDSTHSFMDSKVAEKLKCVLKPASMAQVSVADGRLLGLNAKIDKFQWELRGTQLQADLMVITLRGCDMVLGAQWLETLGPITCDFKKSVMQFHIGQKKVPLQGIRQGSVRDVKAIKLNKLSEDQLQLSMMSVPEVPTEEHHSS
ncbi:hypothetical protein; 60873-62443 [Arabidopsis thaliana]|uniref:Uncharacterized protein F12A4.14 n=1 Tax=Arabidopsis thaliana TaxID=3702 RepID=Q9C8P2_ARATH|nr:hypothetical protein; 60873-62443 [Arabidopsis thaliana]